MNTADNIQKTQAVQKGPRGLYVPQSNISKDVLEFRARKRREKIALEHERSEAKRRILHESTQFPGPANAEQKTEIQTQTIADRFEEEDGVAGVVGGSGGKKWNPKRKRRRRGKRARSGKGTADTARDRGRGRRRKKKVGKKMLANALTVGTGPIGLAVRGVVKIVKAIGLKKILIWTTAIKVSLFQFIFAVLSLIGFAAGAGVKEGVNWLVSWFVDVDYYIIGELFWVIEIFIVILGFLTCIWLFYSAKVKVFDSFSGFMFTILALTFSIFPPLYIFPWILLWVWYINRTHPIPKSG